MTISVNNFNGIFDFDGYDFQDTLCLSFYDVIIKKDFGELKVGERYQAIDVDYEKMRMDGFTGSDPEPTKSFNFILQPYNPNA